MRINHIAIALFILLIPTACAQDYITRDEALYRASIASLIGANSADIATSLPRGCTETNPLLATNGRLEARGIAVKLALTGAVIGVNHFVIRRHGHVRAAAFLNFLSAGATAGIAVHNATAGCATSSR